MNSPAGGRTESGGVSSFQGINMAIGVSSDVASFQSENAVSQALFRLLAIGARTFEANSLHNSAARIFLRYSP